MAIDISADVGKEVTPEQLALVINQARELMSLEIEIGKIEVLLKNKKADHFKMATETLPDLMDSCGQKMVPLANGYSLTLDSVVRASIPAESTIEKADDEERPILEARRADCLAWLKANKAASIIQNELKIVLGTGQGSFGKKLLVLIRKEAKKIKADITTSQKESVNPKRLCSLIKEKLRAGITVPMDTFAAFDGRVAKVVAPKKAKEKKTDGKDKETAS